MNPAALFSPDQQLIALPGWSRPRLLLDVRRSFAWSSLYPAQRPLARLAATGLRLSLALRRPRLRARITETARPDWVTVLRPLRPVAVLVGTPGPAQKLTVAFACDDGRIRLFAKLGWTPAARRRIANEARVLETVPPGFAPAIVERIEAGSHAALLLEALPGRPVHVRREMPEAVRGFLSALRRATDGTDGSGDDRLERLIARFPALAAGLGRLRAMKLRPALGHGDFAPWNVLETADGIRAVDWEYGGATAIPGSDAAFWSLQTDALIRRLQPEAARLRAARRVAEYMDIPPALAEDAVRLVAADALLQALADGHCEVEALQRWRRKVIEG